LRPRLSFLFALGAAVDSGYAKSTGAYEFQGRLRAVNPAAKTFTLASDKGAYVVRVTDQTKIVHQGKLGTLKDVRVGEEVSGVGKFENAKLIATDVIFRATENLSGYIPHGKIPYGIPVPGKPGLVVSPYSPTAGPIGVFGYRRGTPVKDPYTNKVFLVP
jgi:hypothetical protein